MHQRLTGRPGTRSLMKGCPQCRNSRERRKFHNGICHRCSGSGRPTKKPPPEILLGGYAISIQSFLAKKAAEAEKRLTKIASRNLLCIR